MREQDDVLIDVISELRQAKGRGEVFNPRRLRDRVEVIGPAISLDAIAEAIDVKLIERLGSSWDEMFGKLVAYKQQHGNCLVPDSNNDKQLGTWVQNQRMFKKREKLDAARVQRLDDLEFSWDPIEESWEEMFGRLVAYKQQHGNCLVPDSRDSRNSDEELGRWVQRHRGFKRAGKLDPTRVQRLDELGFVWNARK